MVLALVACSDDARPASDGSQASSASSAAAPSQGAAGAGDPYYPNLGNGGYDVEHYDLLLTVDPRTNLLDATATIRATATQSLSRFNLDLLGLQIQSLKVDGLDAEHSRDGGELVITPSQPIEAGESFTVTVLYVGSPEPRSTKAIPVAIGWIATGDGSFVLNEPEGASTWYPVNDHPSDKATYTFHLTVPDGVAAIANGTLVRQVPAGNGQTTWTYEAKDPIASYLTQVAIGDYQLTSTPGPNGITIRNAFASPLAEDATVDFSRTPEMLEFFATQFGPYPFEVYGALVINERKGVALETQTLSIFDSSFVDGSVQGDGVVAHELAHQWFGDSVTPASWKDVWLNEGFATYAEWMWREHVDGAPAAANAAMVHEQLVGSPNSTLTGDPGVDHLFDPGAVYLRGALTLQALRSTIGDDAFFTTLRTYAARFADKNVTTNDFIQVASETAGRDLRELFDAWLYREELPALPS